MLSLSESPNSRKTVAHSVEFSQSATSFLYPEYEYDMWRRCSCVSKMMC